MNTIINQTVNKLETIVDTSINLIETSILTNPVSINVEVNDGRVGASAYEIAVLNGFVGTEQDWLNSLGNSGPIYEADIVDLDKYTKLEVDSFLSDKFDNPTGNNTQYLDGAGTPTTFPTIPSISGLATTTYVDTQDNLKVDKVSGYSLTKNDLTDLLKTAYDNAVTWITTNGSNLLNHLLNFSNPHNVTASQVGTYTTTEINNLISNVNTDSVDRITVKLAESINKGQAVYISSANGTNIIASKASNSMEATSSKTLGVLQVSGTTNDITNVVTGGLLAGLNTSTATIGDPIWLGTSGNLIFGLASKPIAPAHLVYIGVVSRVHAVNGEIFVNVQNGFELNEIHDVLITSPAVGDTLKFDGSLWKNVVENNWVDYSATSTVVGWSSFTTKVIQVLNVDNKFLIVIYVITGVSNNTTTKFTIPNNSFVVANTSRAQNNGIFQTNMGFVESYGTNEIYFYLNTSGTNFASTGTKSIMGQFIVKIA